MPAMHSKQIIVIANADALKERFRTLLSLVSQAISIRLLSTESALNRKAQNLVSRDMFTLNAKSVGKLSR